MELWIGSYHLVFPVSTYVKYYATMVCRDHWRLEFVPKCKQCRQRGFSFEGLMETDKYISKSKWYKQKPKKLQRFKNRVERGNSKHEQHQHDTSSVCPGISVTERSRMGFQVELFLCNMSFHSQWGSVRLRVEIKMK